MKFIRSIARVTLFDLKRSEDIRTQLNIYKIKDKIEQQKKIGAMKMKIDFRKPY